jgi:hypothetical protein
MFRFYLSGREKTRIPYPNPHNAQARGEAAGGLLGPVLLGPGSDLSNMYLAKVEEASKYWVAMAVVEVRGNPRPSAHTALERIADVFFAIVGCCTRAAEQPPAEANRKQYPRAQSARILRTACTQLPSSVVSRGSIHASRSCMLTRVLPPGSVLTFLL